jgi:hypothetical protein
MRIHPECVSLNLERKIMNQITVNPVTVNPIGAKAIERKLSVVNYASGSAMLALIGEKGEVGKVCRAGLVARGVADITQAAFNANYRPVAEYLAVKLDRPIIISNRASFESLPDLLDGIIHTLMGKKNGGYKTDKDGLQVPVPALATALHIKGEIVDMLRDIAAKHEALKAEREAAKVE